MSTEESSTTVGPDATADVAGPRLGALLRVAWQRIRDQISADVERAGFDDIGGAHLHVFRYPGPDGARPSELADRLQISRQAVNDLLGQLEARSYLVREPDPVDGRGRIVGLTARGCRLQRAVDAAALAAEQRVAEAVGQRRLDAMRDVLEIIARDEAGAGGRATGTDRR